MPRLLYTLLIYLLLPLVPVKLLWRSLRQPEYLQHWQERLGIYAQPLPDATRLIWLHCVSVGETRAAAPLVHELRQRYPQHRLLLTHATPTGRAAGEQLFGDDVLRAYLPYDLPNAVSRFLLHFRPQIGLLMETELWFNLIAACAQQEIPLLLVNARMSAKSAKGYARVRGLVTPGLQRLTAIAAQTSEDAVRLKQLGACNIEVLGNLKFDVRPALDAAAKGEHLRRQFGGRPVLLAASTRDGEENLILQAVAAANIAQLLTIIVPRHPQRFDQVAGLLEQGGLRFVRRSRLAAMTAHDTVPVEVPLLLGDSMGEMFTYYAACDVAFIGGSLLPLGGQNLIEACVMGKPVLIGPHTFNFAEASEQAIACGAAMRVHDVDELSARLRELFGDPALRLHMGQAARNFSAGAIGASQRVADLVERYLPRNCD